MDVDGTVYMGGSVPLSSHTGAVSVKGPISVGKLYGLTQEDKRHLDSV